MSPRVGIAYPISDRDVMSFHYGRLFQVPDRLYLYQGRNISAEARGNPNLEPQTTISYQLGVQHLFSKEIYGQFGVYFNDIYGLLTTVEQQVPGFADHGADPGERRLRIDAGDRGDAHQAPQPRVLR